MCIPTLTMPYFLSQSPSTYQVRIMHPFSIHQVFKLVFSFWQLNDCLKFPMATIVTEKKFKCINITVVNTNVCQAPLQYLKFIGILAFQFEKLPDKNTS